MNRPIGEGALNTTAQSEHKVLTVLLESKCSIREEGFVPIVP